MNNICQSIRNCQECDLCKNQIPLVQNNTKQIDVFWVGLSAVKAKDESEIPLSPTTNSGKLIHSIEFTFSADVSFYKTNIVKCLPLKDDKIRYPSISEMKKCYSHLETEINTFNPKIIFLLGKQVADFVLNRYNMQVSLDDNFDYNKYSIEQYRLVPIHHPSFILVYKRKKLSDYLHGIENIIETLNSQTNKN
jgi:DNA polymerase